MNQIKKLYAWITGKEGRESTKGIANVNNIANLSFYCIRNTNGEVVFYVLTAFKLIYYRIK